MRHLPRLIAVLVIVYAAGAVWRYVDQSRAVTPARVDPMPTLEKKDELRILLVGDTGLPGTQRDRVRAQILREDKDLIVALGDLTYPHPPPCETGRVEAKDIPFFEQRIARGLEGLRAPVLALLGNHEYYRGPRSAWGWIYPFVPTTLEQGDPGDGRVVDPAACVVDFIAQRPQIHLPALDYGLDLGVAQIALVDTDHLDEKAADVVKTTFARGEGWKLLMGHHVLKTYHDKEDEDYVAPWLREFGIVPELYANGHAHVLQMGVYDGIPAITSGTGAKIRHRPACPPDCGPGQLWGVSSPGYAVLHLTKKSLRIEFKDDTGSVRYTWSKTR